MQNSILQFLIISTDLYILGKLTRRERNCKIKLCKQRLFFYLASQITRFNCPCVTQTSFLVSCYMVAFLVCEDIKFKYLSPLINVECEFLQKTEIDNDFELITKCTSPEFFYLFFKIT